MSKQTWKPGNMLYPLPAVMVTSGDKAGNTNILTIAWTGTICTNPPMVYISVRPERYSYRMIKETGEFVINLTTEQLASAADYCGVKSGRDVDKWKMTGLHSGKADMLQYAPIIEESPVNIECKVTEIRELGSHHMFLAEVKAVRIEDTYLNEQKKFELNRTGLLAYSHGEYLGLSEPIGTFGYSIRRKKAEPHAPEKRATGKKALGKHVPEEKRASGKNASKGHEPEKHAAGKNVPGKHVPEEKRASGKNASKGHEPEKRTSGKKGLGRRMSEKRVAGKGRKR